MFVYVADVLGLQLVAIVVNFVLNIERRVGIDGFAALHEHDVHVRQRVVGQSEHLMDVFILLCRKVFLARMAAVDGACEVVTAVADTFYLADFAQHGSDFALRFVAQMGVAHLIQVLGNLYFHVVADTFILLDTGKELYESFVVLRLQQFHYHAKHTLDAFAKAADFLLCFENGELGSLHNAGLNEAQTEVFLVFVGLGLDGPAHESLNPTDESR